MKEKKKPFYKKWWFWLIVAVVIIAMIVPEEEEATKEDVEETQEETSKEDKKAAEEKKEKEDAEQKEKEANKKAEEDKKKEEKAKQEQEEAKKKTAEKKANRTTEEVLIEEGIADEIDLYEGEITISHEPETQWSENSLMRVVYDMFDNLPIAFKDNEIDSVVNMIDVNMVDNKGNEGVKSVITYRYTREDYEALNYDNFKEMALGEEWRILNESDAYFINAGIRNKLKDKYTDNLY